MAVEQLRHQLDRLVRPRASPFLDRAAGVALELLELAEQDARNRRIRVGVAGLTLFICGVWGAANNLVWGGDTAWVVGLIYAMLGLCCGAVTWAMHEHFDPNRVRDPSLIKKLRDAETALAEVRRACDRITRIDPKFPARDQRQPARPIVADDSRRVIRNDRPISPSQPQRTTDVAYVPLPPQFQYTDYAGAQWQPANYDYFTSRDSGRKPEAYATTQGEPDLPEVEVLVLLRRRLVDLEEWERFEQRLEAQRERLASYRTRMSVRQTDWHAKRSEWQNLLRQHGMPDKMKAREAFAVWDRASSSRDLQNEYRLAKETYQRDQQQLDDYLARVETLARRIHGEGRHERLAADYHNTLSDWERRLHSHTGSRQERNRLSQAADQKRREADNLEPEMERLRGKVHSLLSRAGVNSREDLSDRIRDQHRAGDVQRQWETARDELSAIANSEPELAIVEDDLHKFHPERNRQSMEELRRELTEIDGHLPRHHEELGRYKQELNELEQDRRHTGLRFDRAQIAGELQQAVERWAAVQVAGQAVERVRGKVEKASQPQLLKLASKYLTDLTSGKYHNIWTPLGERHLVIDDDAGQSQRVEHLSSGTREQVFLAVRLAMVKDFAERGADLPMVLDDVFVNFDQVRTESAVRTLLEFADQGQQVLFFTCHLHLAHLFENQGVEPVWLPGHSPALEDRRAG